MSSIREGVKHPVSTVHRLFEEVPSDASLPPLNRIRKWAAQNAYTLTFLSACFVITWTLQIIMVVVR